jgi:alkanesulfonate monooxygenase SsuD/methylene tetrahydromethanopterin reductase-like flavin-dependent oxidoreductase (luciferase family)
MRAFAIHAEEIGLDSLWICDHLLSRAEDGDVAIHESWTIVSALAASTARIELGQLVMCMTFRNPALLAKMAVTADAVGDQRLVLGLGAGWHDPEYLAFGYPTDHRVSRFDEALQIIAPLLRGEQVSVNGRYHQVRDAVLLPAPERRIPILVAGHGPRMLQLTAGHADAWNTAWYGLPDERLHRRLADLRAALDAERRDPATLRHTVGISLDSDRIGSAASWLAGALDAYERLGIDDVIVSLRPADQPQLDLIARAVDIRGR